MNPRDLLFQLKRILPSLKLNTHFYGDDNPGYTHIFTDLVKYRGAIKALKSLSIYPLDKEEEQKLSIILNTDRDSIAVKDDAYTAIRAASNLYDTTNILVNYLEKSFSQEEDGNTIGVKLVNVDSLDELEKTANLLKRSFNAPVLELVGQLSIQAIERGSVWFILAIAGTSMVLKMCANLIWAAVVIRNKSKEAAIVEEHARTIKLKNDTLEALIQQHKDHIEQSKEAEAMAIVNGFVTSNNPETIQQFKVSIESIGTLIEKGADFYPSLKAAPEVKELFPDFNSVDLIESKIKLLDKGDSK